MNKLSSPILAEHTKVQLGADVTVGMSTYGDLATTTAALQSLFSAAEGEFEVLLIDNCSRDQALNTLLDQIRAYHKNTTIFSFAENRQYTGAMNAILSHARGEWVVCLSNDILTTPSYFRELLDVARSNPRYGIVRGSSNFVDNGKATHNVRLSHPPTSISDVFHASQLVYEKYPAEPVLDEFLTGDAFLVSRKVIERIGTFDLQFFGLFPDHDFGIRAQIGGFDQILARRAFAYHKQAANFDCMEPNLRSEKLTERWALVHENWARFKMKYGFPPERPYTSIFDIPWKKLTEAEFNPAKHYVTPGNYLEERW